LKNEQGYPKPRCRTKEDFDYEPFSQQGSLGKAHQLFGEQLPRLLDELNEALAA
jgi:type I restriction enzyme R subunit